VEFGASTEHREEGRGQREGTTALGGHREGTGWEGEGTVCQLTPTLTLTLTLTLSHPHSQ